MSSILADVFQQIGPFLKRQPWPCPPPVCRVLATLICWKLPLVTATQPGFSHPIPSTTWAKSCSASLRCGHRPGLFLRPKGSSPAQIGALRFGEIKKYFCAQMGTEFGVGNVALPPLDSRCFMGTCFSVRKN